MCAVCSVLCGGRDYADAHGTVKGHGAAVIAASIASAVVRSSHGSSALAGAAESCRSQKRCAAAEACAADNGHVLPDVGLASPLAHSRHCSACRLDLRAVEHVERFRQNGTQAVEYGSKLRSTMYSQ
jgi:hypothetical protein|uniref:Uncharacterized protein n=1 Tax=Haptolina ericina TaxID=156174 RepID=A0A7S3F2M9_9EUKA|mmetsp:Transcript_49097/g.110405  ORF Transcript_49097/g.110405 Transcript_49097/m.110405 type:complete len:127 (+) Transcript_49097:507-887(+)